MFVVLNFSSFYLSKIADVLDERLFFDARFEQIRFFLTKSCGKRLTKFAPRGMKNTQRAPREQNAPFERDFFGRLDAGSPARPFPLLLPVHPFYRQRNFSTQ